MRVRPFFRWYHLWVGVFYDRASHVLYVCPLPMIGLQIRLPLRCDICGKIGSHQPYCVRASY